MNEIVTVTEISKSAGDTTPAMSRDRGNLPGGPDYRRREALILALTFCIAVLGSILGAQLIIRGQSQATAPRLLPVASERVIGYVPSAGSLYTLVEFFDYQCPPCREVRGNVKGIEDLYKGKIRVVYRNFPLAMHLHAASAAAAAEAARDQGKFDVVHEALLAGKSLDDPEIVLLAHNAGLNQQRFRSAWKHSATLRVAADRRLGEALGIDSTPSFVFCTPRGQTWRLKRLEQVHDLIKD